MSLRTDEFALRLVDQLRVRCEAGIDRIKAFVRFNRQVEGWFKGELLNIGAHMLDTGQAREFRPDYGMAAMGRQNIDLYFVPNFRTPIWIELKHWYVGRYANGSTWSATSYFIGNTSGTPSALIAKLPDEWSGHVYLLIIVTPNPMRDDWSRGLRRLQEKQPNWKIRALTKPEEFPANYYIGLLNLVRRDSGRATDVKGGKGER